MSFPNMLDAFRDWQNNAKFTIVTKDVVDFQTEEVLAEYNFDGLFYPKQAREIALKPEGQRTWRWWSMVTSKDLELDTIVKDVNGKQFRVMASTNYSIAGFYDYDLTEDFVDDIEP
jgi:hypothetical protein